MCLCDHEILVVHWIRAVDSIMISCYLAQVSLIDGMNAELKLFYKFRFQLYRSHLVLRSRNAGAVSGDEIRRDLEMVESVEEGIEPEGSIVSGFMVYFSFPVSLDFLDCFDNIKLLQSVVRKPGQQKYRSYGFYFHLFISLRAISSLAFLLDVDNLNV